MMNDDPDGPAVAGHRGHPLPVSQGAGQRREGAGALLETFGQGIGPRAEAVLKYMSMTEHLDDFLKGVVDTKHLIYYLSFITFGLFLTVKSVDSERWRG